MVFAVIYSKVIWSVRNMIFLSVKFMDQILKLEIKFLFSSSRGLLGMKKMEVDTIYI
jgi:hypothetical protein